MQIHFRRWPKYLAGNSAVTFDSQNIYTGRLAQIQMLQRFAGERRLIRYTQTVFAVGEPIFIYPSGEVGTVGAFRPMPSGGQPATGKGHVKDAQNENWHSEGRKGKEVKAGHAVTLEFTIDDEVRGGRHKRRHAAYQCGHTERHHQAAWCYGGA
ncbi:MAG TPA: hypothetical protein VH369_12210, partial [Bryobacteraceae bacterium]